MFFWAIASLVTLAPYWIGIWDKGTSLLYFAGILLLGLALLGRRVSRRVQGYWGLAVILTGVNGLLVLIFGGTLILSVLYAVIVAAYVYSIYWRGDNGKPPRPRGPRGSGGSGTKGEPAPRSTVLTGRGRPSFDVIDNPN